MNKQETIDMFSNVAEISKVDAKKYLEAVLETFTKALIDGEEIKLTGFGTFSVTDKPARTGRNPLTKETIEIEAKRAPKFKAAKGLKDSLNVK